MTIQSYKLGPGTLKLGTGGTLDVSAQVRACTVTPAENVTTTDDLPVLSGEVLTGDSFATYTYTLTGTLIQDLAAAGVVDYSWTNAGVEVDVEFVPNTVEARKVTGTVRMVPIAIGGEVGAARPTSDFTWTFTETPAFAAV